MSSSRRISRKWKSRPTVEGAGVHLKRAFGFQHVPQLDPFLLLDDFHSLKPDHYLPGFPWHPHRGIETITYMRTGVVAHGDSIGNAGTIAGGDVQWMTAGSGIVHQEMPQGDEKGELWGLQLWANLPARNKMMDPRYQEFKEVDIPWVTDGSGAKIRIICGEEQRVQGPVRDIVTGPQFLEVTVPPKTSFTHAIRPGNTAFAYILEGEGYFDEGRDSFDYDMENDNYYDITRPCLCGPENLVLYHREGDSLAISTEQHPVKFLLISGKPIGEPVAWYGPIVMNTREELRIAFEEYEHGTFIKYRAKV